MNRQDIDIKMKTILDALQEVKNGIVSDCTAELMVTGVMPQKSQEELKVFADLTGAVFSSLNQLGYELTDDAERDGLVLLTVGGSAYSCAKVNLKPNFVSKAPLTASEAYSAIKQDLKQEEVQEKEKEKEEEVTLVTREVPPPVPTQESSTPSKLYDLDDEEFEQDFEEKTDSVPTASEEDAASVDDDEFDLDDEFETETKADAEDISTPSNASGSSNNDAIELDDDIFEEDSTEDKTPASFDEHDDDFEKEDGIEVVNAQPETKDDEFELEDEIQTISYESEKEEELVYVPKANIIGGGSGNFTKNDIFIEEQSKFANEFVYSTTKISVLHQNIGSRPEEMIVMIAPLKISKYSCINVPIVVTIFNRGKSVTVSSYDTLGEGKNLVLIDINEFYFLCRGSFDDNGKFIPFIATTGISANQGDKINILSNKVYGNTLNRETRNGHIKFRYDSDSGPGTIEVIPFGKPGENDFVAIIKNDEFVDYYLISNSLHANKCPIVYTGNGNKKELVCQWEDDNLTAELVER